MKKEVVQSIIDENHQGYNQIAEQFANTRKFSWRLFDLFRPYVNAGDIILDAGCGNGRLFDFFKNIKISYYGIDSSEKLISIAKKVYAEANFRVGDITTLPFKDHEFNAIFCIATLHHIPGKNLRHQAIKEFGRVLKPGGYLIMTNWNLWSLRWWPVLIKSSLNKLIGKSELDWGDIQKPWKNSYGNIITKRYLHAFTKNEINKMLKKYGFEKIIQRYTSHDVKKSWPVGYNLLTMAKKS